MPFGKNHGGRRLCVECFVMTSRVFVRVHLTAQDEDEIVVGRWFNLPFLPRIGDSIHYGDNWPADRADVENVEIWVDYDVIVCVCFDEGLETLADAEELGTECVRDGMCKLGFTVMERGTLWIDPEA